jgi:hypothetical protein
LCPIHAAITATGTPDRCIRVAQVCRAACSLMCRTPDSANSQAVSEAVVGDRRQQRLNLGLGVSRGWLVRLADPIDEFGDVAANDAVSFGIGQYLLCRRDDLVDGIRRPRPPLPTLRCLGSSGDEIAH